MSWLCLRIICLLLTIIPYIICKTYWCNVQRSVHFKPIYKSPDIAESSGLIQTQLNASQEIAVGAKTCQWRLPPLPGKRWQLNITRFHMMYGAGSRGSRCTPRIGYSHYDRLFIYAGRSVNGLLIASACSRSQNPQSVISTGQGLYIIWFSDVIEYYSVRNRGVTIKFNSFDQNSCPSNWTEYRGSCLKLKKHRKTFKDAQQYCRYDQSNLAIIQDQEEYDLIKSLQSKDGSRTSTDVYFIAAYDTSARTDFIFLDKTSFNDYGFIFRNWRTGYPRNSYVKRCIGIDESGLLIQTSCIYKRYFICKRNKVGKTVLFGIPDLKLIGKQAQTKTILATYKVLIGVGCVAFVVIIIAIQYRRKYSQGQSHLIEMQAIQEQGMLEAHTSSTVPPSETRLPTEPPGGEMAHQDTLNGYNTEADLPPAYGTVKPYSDGDHPPTYEEFTKTLPPQATNH